MTLSFGTLTLRFQPRYHRRNRPAKHEGPQPLVRHVGRARKARPDSQDFMPYLWPAAAVPFAAMTTTIRPATTSGGETGVHAATATRGGIRHRGSQARA